MKAQITALVALLGAIGAATLAPDPPEPPTPTPIADNLQEICTTECRWVGEEWVCTTICY